MSVALALNLACSGAEPEKAIFVVPDTTVVDPPEELPASPSTTLEFDSGEITDVSAQRMTSRLKLRVKRPQLLNPSAFGHF